MLFTSTSNTEPTIFAVQPDESIGTPIEYFASPGGADSNPGTETQPFRTIGRGVSALATGDTLWVREGTYHEQVTVRQNGVTVRAYPGEQPVIDGQGNIPSGWDYLLNLAGNQVTVEGIEVRNSASVGVGLTGQHNTVRALYVHHSYDGGILSTGPYNLIEGCETWWNSTKREYGRDSGYWSWGMAAVRTHDVTFRGNRVHQNWGEGIGPWECQNITIEDNTVYDNWAVNVYLNRIAGGLVRRNFVYGVPGSDVEAAWQRAPGIGMADEGMAELSNLAIVNNIVYNTPNSGIYFWRDAKESGLKDVLIAHNSVEVPRAHTLEIHQGSHSNVQIVNNVWGTSGVSVARTQELHFDHNLWQSAPLFRALGDASVIGNPLFAGGVGTPAAEWFRLQARSPAIDAGRTLREVSEDYWGTVRDSMPDIGAFEYQDGLDAG